MLSQFIKTFTKPKNRLLSPITNQNPKLNKKPIQLNGFHALYQQRLSNRYSFNRVQNYPKSRRNFSIMPEVKKPKLTRSQKTLYRIKWHLLDMLESTIEFVAGCREFFIVFLIMPIMIMIITYILMHAFFFLFGSIE